tara:strand:- start:1333 stop:1812 length:480 start_codon:yes stop_codon:yes gene_type:complete
MILNYIFIIYNLSYLNNELILKNKFSCIKNTIKYKIETNPYIIDNNISISYESRIKNNNKIIYNLFTKRKLYPHDIYGFRIIYKNMNDVSDILTSYIIKNIIENEYELCNELYDDYIKNPKKNNYQSIHLYIKTPLLIEIQLRNNEMHKRALTGSASQY